jgi:hypothetical protein
MEEKPHVNKNIVKNFTSLAVALALLLALVAAGTMPVNAEGDATYATVSAGTEN